MEVINYRLTAREIEVLSYMKTGMTNVEIAQKLYVDKGTIKAHVGHIFEKLSVKNRVQAIVKAIKENLI